MGALHDTLLNSALDLAARGFKVFPLEPGKKTPAVKGWQEKATTDPDVIRRVWGQRDYNIGVKTGDGLVVVDIDVKNNKPGAQSWKALGLSADEVDTFRVRTASGGWHVYFVGDGSSSVDRLGPGLDIRADGGYVVGPGSTLTNGSGSGSYAIASDHELRPLPVGLGSRMAVRPERTPADHRPAVDLDRTDAVERAAAYLRADAPLALEGTHGDLTTYKVAAQIKDFGVSETQAYLLLDEHWNERCSPPWEPDELKEKVRNAYAYGSKPPGSDHPAAAFGGVSLDSDLERPAQPAASRWSWHGDGWDRNLKWSYHLILPAEGVACIVGPPQSGKSFVVIELCRSQATGKPFFGVAPDDIGGVAYLYAGTEGSALPMRLAALGELSALPIAWTPISDLSARGALGKIMDELKALNAQMKATFGVPLRIVVLETLNASGLLVNENDNAEIGVAFANLARISREVGCLVITTHHPPKNGEGLRGGGAIEGSCDYVMEITREGTEAIRRLEITKARDAEQRQLGTFTLLKADLGEDDRGRPITSMTISMGEPMARKNRRIEYADIFMQAVEFALVESIDMPEGHKAAPRDTVLACFRELKPGVKDSPNAVVAFKRCLEYAKDAGAIETGMFGGEQYLWIKEMPE